MRYIAINGMEETEIKADSIVLKIDDGTEVELYYRHSDKEISISINGKMRILPVASNVIRVERVK